MKYYWGQLIKFLSSFRSSSHHHTSPQNRERLKVLCRDLTGSKIAGTTQEVDHKGAATASTDEEDDFFDEDDEGKQGTTVLVR